MTSLNQNATGVDFDLVEKTPTFAPGTIVLGSDGHDYVYAKATDAIADDAVCTLAEPELTMSTGAGDWTNVNGALVANDYTWFKKTAI